MYDFIVSGSFWTFRRVLLLPSLDRWHSLAWPDGVFFFFFYPALGARPPLLGALVWFSFPATGQAALTTSRWSKTGARNLTGGSMLSQPPHLRLIPESPLSSPVPSQNPGLALAHCLPSAVQLFTLAPVSPGLDLQAQPPSHLHAGHFRTQGVGTGRGWP